MEKRSFNLKVVVGGNGGVGKTSLIQRYCTNTFKEDSKMTIGVGFLSKKTCLPYNEETYDFCYTFWDLGGQERFRFMQTTYAKGAHAFIAAFDMTRYESLLNLDPWLDLFYKDNDPDRPTIIIGTKKDIWDPEKGGIQREEIQQKMTELQAGHCPNSSNFGYIDTSAKTGEGIQEVFQAVGYWTIAYNQAHPSIKPGITG